MENDNKIFDLLGMRSSNEKIRAKYFAIGIFSIIATIILVLAVLDIGEDTAEYGDRFAYNQLFVLKEDAELFSEKTKKTKTLKAKKGEVFVLKAVTGDFAIVEPFSNGLSVRGKKGREKELVKKGFTKKEGQFIAYIKKSDGMIKTPLQQNVDQLLENSDLYDGDNLEEDYKLKSLLNFFSMRKNIIYLYYVMALFLIVFNYILIRRLIFLYQNHLDQNKINEILSKATGRGKKLDELSKNENSTLPSAFISTLHRSYKLDGSKAQFNNIYNDFLDRDRELEQTFSQKIALCNIWIIRAGIFGTLVGLIIAFFELYIAVGGIVVGEQLPQYFITQIQQALLGNALSIATSISAHGASLVLELVVVSLISGESNVSWIEETYLNVLHYKEYRPKEKTPVEAVAVMTTAVDEMTTEFDLVTKSLKELSPGAQTTKALIDTMNGALLQINQGLDDINKDLEETKDTIKHFMATGSQIDYKVLDTKKLVENAHKKMEMLHQESTEFSSYLGKNIESFRNVAGEAVENTQSIIGSVSDKLRTIKENLKK